MATRSLLQYPLNCSSGRPRVDVSIDKIEYLRGLGFTWTKIANLIGISRSTLYRRLDEEGIDIGQTYTLISDHDLDFKLKSIKLIHPHDGERLIIGHLRSQGVVVPRARVRASIHRVDPVNTALRRSIVIRRRVYCVQGPNSLWHIDGHHKLIKWRLVTHGGIDGFSRTVVYLHCSANNEARTVLSAFCDAVSQYGLPEQVRSDRGGENIEVWRYMLDEHQSESAVLVGSSTHNERIERLWRDVQRCVIVLFADLFRQMEDEGHLNCLNEVDIFCLHTVFLPRINQALTSFIESWNNHPISTEHNQTPNQLFIHGAITQNMTPTFPSTNRRTNMQIPNSDDPVSLPRSLFNPCDVLLNVLDNFNMVSVEDDLGYALFRQVCDVVGRHIQHCDDCVCD